MFLLIKFSFEFYEKYDQVQRRHLRYKPWKESMPCRLHVSFWILGITPYLARIPFVVEANDDGDRCDVRKWRKGMTETEESEDFEGSRVGQG